jgi:hypothetical protein
MANWEYEIRTINPTWTSENPGGVPNGVEIIEGYLNGMGDVGWELVGFIPIPQNSPLDPDTFHAVFKRPK